MTESDRLSTPTEGEDLPVAEWQYRVWWNGDGGEPQGWGEWQKVKARSRLSSESPAAR